MNKLLVASILSAVSVVGAAELIDTLAPKASAVTLDGSLQNIYKDAYADSLLTGEPVSEVLAARIAELQSADQALTFYVDADGSLVASNDWACRRLIVGDFIQTVDCE